MLVGRSRSRRLFARSLAQPFSVATRHHDLRERPGLRFPRWPSLASLVGDDTSASRRVDQTSRRFITTKSRYEASGAYEPDADDVDDYGDWSTITALESSRKNLDWRNQLVTQEQFEQQSSLSEDSDGDLLVHRHSSDFELWQELFFYRLRVHGPSGITELWQHLLLASQQHTTRLWELPRLWRALEDLAVDNDVLLRDLIRHIGQMRDIYIDKPDGFYERIIVDKLGKDGHQAVQWHQLLSIVHPDRRETRSLIKTLAGQPVALERFKDICFRLAAFRDMYSFVIPLLTQKSLITEALEWHDLLLAHDDHPSSFEPAERLLRTLRKQGSNEMIYKVARELTDLGLADGRRWLRFGDTNQMNLFRGVLETLKSSEGLPQQLHGSERQDQPVAEDGATPIGDSIVARLFATSLFSIETIVQGLCDAKCDSIGPLAFREAVLRVAEGDEPGSIAVNRTVNLLAKSGIEIKKISFSTLIISLAEQGKDSILIDLLRSEQHPEVLEDIKLQQTLLLEYLRQNDQPAADRTMEIIRSLNPSQFEVPGALSNWSLEHAINMSDQKSVTAQLDRMFAARERVDFVLFDRAFKCLLHPRRHGHKPQKYDELDTLIKFLTLRTRIGQATHPRQWTEIIVRLGFTHQLAKLEQVCIWLVSWSKDPAFRRSLALGPRGMLEDSGRDEFLRNIFNKNTIQGLLKWGFTAALTHAEPNELAQVLSGSPAEKRDTLARNTVLFGLQLLRQLKDLGLRLADPAKEIEIACDITLIRLFGSMESRSKINRRIRVQRIANMQDYAAAMELVWGERLFPSKAPLANGGAGDPGADRLKDYTEWLMSYEGEKAVERRKKLYDTDVL